MIKKLSLAAVAAFVLAPAAHAQWTYRYPKLDDFGHQIYLEQHELPALGYGPTDPAPSPDGTSLAFAAQGWIWLLDFESGVAKRLTTAAGVDARPRWSPNGRQLTFVRDSGSDTAVIVHDVATGKEQVIDTPTIDLDPEFSDDGRYLFYTSGVGGSLSVWRQHLASGVEEQLTEYDQVERNVRRLPGGDGIVYLHGSGAHRVIRERSFKGGQDRVVHAETLTYHLATDVHPDARVLVYAAPIDNQYHLWTLDLDDSRVTRRITSGTRYAMTPAFSHDGKLVYFAEPDGNRQFRIMVQSVWGGKPRAVEVGAWDYGTRTATLTVRATDADGEPATARVSIAGVDGHPVSYERDATYYDSQTGRHYFYVEGEAELTVPEGRYQITATRGPMAPVARDTKRVRVGRDNVFDVSFEPIWSGEGYASIDHHVHLNGDGHHPADHDDALRLLAGEALDQVAPMSWNRWERRIDEPLVGTVTERDGRAVVQGQEVRSHFHGHIGLVDVRQPFEPWFFGPSNPTLGNPNLTNGDVFTHAASTGAFPTYVHPLAADTDPFEDLDAARIPLELVSDGVLEGRMGLEIVCAWTSPLGNSQLWYRLLNIGQPIAAMSGTDSWVDFHRTPAMGTGRTYVRVGDAEPTPDAVLAGAAAGRSFVTTGPALEFTVGDSAPGDTIGNGKQAWQATLTSTVDIDVFEIVVNGEVVDTREGVIARTPKTMTGTVTLPEGGWVAARAYTSERQADAWPTMHARPFAHSSPVWIGEIGSTDPDAQADAAADLLLAIGHAERRAQEAYGDRDMSRLFARFLEARRKLGPMLKEQPLNTIMGAR
ncbi:MAG: CehA/McbA family metallohydrolase [Pseudomonadota bacterium]